MSKNNAAIIYLMSKNYITESSTSIECSKHQIFSYCCNQIHRLPLALWQLDEISKENKDNVLSRYSTLLRNVDTLADDYLRIKLSLNENIDYYIETNDEEKLRQIAETHGKIDVSEDTVVAAFNTVSYPLCINLINEDCYRKVFECDQVSYRCFHYVFKIEDKHQRYAKIAFMLDRCGDSQPSDYWHSEAAEINDTELFDMIYSKCPLMNVSIYLIAAANANRTDIINHIKNTSNQTTIQLSHYSWTLPSLQLLQEMGFSIVVAVEEFMGRRTYKEVLISFDTDNLYNLYEKHSELFSIVKTFHQLTVMLKTTDKEQQKQFLQSKEWCWDVEEIVALYREFDIEPPFAILYHKRARHQGHWHQLLKQLPNYTKQEVSDCIKDDYLYQAIDAEYATDSIIADNQLLNTVEALYELKHYIE